MDNIQSVDNLLKDVYDAIHEIDNKALLKAGQMYPEIMNVIRGIQIRAFASYYNAEDDAFHLIFVGENNGPKGFSLIFTYQPDTYFNFILLYSFFLAGEFKYLNPIHS